MYLPSKTQGGDRSIPTQCGEASVGQPGGGHVRKVSSPADAPRRSSTPGPAPGAPGRLDASSRPRRGRAVLEDELPQNPQRFVSTIPHQHSTPFSPPPTPLPHSPGQRKAPRTDQAQTTQPVVHTEADRLQPDPNSAPPKRRGMSAARNLDLTFAATASPTPQDGLHFAATQEPAQCFLMPATQTEAAPALQGKLGAKGAPAREWPGKPSGSWRSFHSNRSSYNPAHPSTPTDDLGILTQPTQDCWNISIPLADPMDLPPAPASASYRVVATLNRPTHLPSAPRTGIGAGGC